LWNAVAADHVLTVTDGLVRSRQNLYDAVGNLLTAFDPVNHRMTNTYTAKTSWAVMGADTSRALPDVVGNATGRTDGNGHSTTFGYLMRPTIDQSTDALGQPTITASDLGDGDVGRSGGIRRRQAMIASIVRSQALTRWDKRRRRL